MLQAVQPPVVLAPMLVVFHQKRCCSRLSITSRHRNTLMSMALTLRACLWMSPKCMPAKTPLSSKTTMAFCICLRKTKSLFSTGGAALCLAATTVLRWLSPVKNQRPLPVVKSSWLQALARARCQVHLLTKSTCCPTMAPCVWVLFLKKLASSARALLASKWVLSGAGWVQKSPFWRVSLCS